MIGEVNRYNLTILVDLNYLGIRSAFRFQDFSVTTERGVIKTGSLIGVLQFLELISVNYPFAEIILCNDGSAQERKEMFEGYKASRVPTAEKPVDLEISSWRNLKPELFRILGGIPNLMVLQCPTKEADDLMAKLGYLKIQQGKDVVIFTSDKDLMQMMSIGVNISKEISEGELVLLTEDYVLNHDKLGVEPKYIPYLRPWNGDPSDDIPPAVSRVLKPIRAAVAKRWYELGQPLTDESMARILDSITEVNITPATRKKFMDGIEQANLNFKLMDLTRYATENIENVQVVPLEYNVDTIKYYALNRYLSWREGKSMQAVNVNALIDAQNVAQPQQMPSQEVDSSLWNIDSSLLDNLQ